MPCSALVASNNKFYLQSVKCIPLVELIPIFKKYRSESK